MRTIIKLLGLALLAALFMAVGTVTIVFLCPAFAVQVALTKLLGLCNSGFAYCRDSIRLSVSAGGAK